MRNLKWKCRYRTFVCWLVCLIISFNFISKRLYISSLLMKVCTPAADMGYFFHPLEVWTVSELHYTFTQVQPSVLCDSCASSSMTVIVTWQKVGLHFGDACSVKASEVLDRSEYGRCYDCICFKAMLHNSLLWSEIVSILVKDIRVFIYPKELQIMYISSP